MSVVTYIELAQGCRDKAELVRLKKGLTQRGTQIISITEAISERAIQLIEQYALASGLQLGDALIAATALEHGFPLLTGNNKHFAPIGKHTVEKFALAAPSQ